MAWPLALLLIALAVLLWWLSARQSASLGLPDGRVLYEDSGAQRRLEEPLFAEDLGLVGKPDYLVQGKQGLVPVEVKSGRTPKKPFDSHVFQLAAYCALVERNFGKRPAYGIIRYPERSFTVEYSQGLEDRLLALLSEMQAALGSGEMHRSHPLAARCRACGYGQLCDESL